MKRFTVFAVLMGFVVISFLIARPALTDQQNEKKAAEPASLEQMHKDRIATLERLVEVLKEQYRAGGVGFNELSTAQDDLIEAKLETATQPAERIALLEKQVEAAKEAVEFAESRFKQGITSEADYLRAKAHLLNIQIKLAREQAQKKK